MTALDASAIAPTSRRAYSTAWWGMATVVMTESMVFLVLLAAALYLRAGSTEWPPAGVDPPELSRALPFSIVLWASSIPIFVAEPALRAGNIARFRRAVALSSVLGLAFLAYTVLDFHELHFGWRDHAYGSAFYTIVGLHAIHVAIGLLMSAVVQVKATLGRYDAHHHTSAQVYFLYWHFVDVVWVFVFLTMFVGPNL